LPRLASKDHLLLFCAGLIAAPFLFVINRYLLDEVVDPVVFGFRNYEIHISYSYYLFDNIYRSLPVIFLSIAAWSLKRSYFHELEIKQLREEKTLAELAFLKSQVNPHFLYNTLNYIYSLAYPVSENLADAIIKLSKMMQYILHESVGSMVALQKEIDYLNNYIALYRLRFKDKFYVNFDSNVTDPSAQVPSFVLIPLVENALKHGVVNNPEYPIEINLIITEHKLTFSISNKINDYQKDGSSGIGLNNVNKRLALLYPNRHEMVVNRNSLNYKTTLIIFL
jgi:two-component system LytT family sensor kinase